MSHYISPNMHGNIEGGQDDFRLSYKQSDITDIDVAAFHQGKNPQEINRKMSVLKARITFCNVSALYAL